MPLRWYGTCRDPYIHVYINVLGVQRENLRRATQHYMYGQYVISQLMLCWQLKSPVWSFMWYLMPPHYNRATQ